MSTDLLTDDEKQLLLEYPWPNTTDGQAIAKLLRAYESLVKQVEILTRDLSFANDSLEACQKNGRVVSHAKRATETDLAAEKAARVAAEKALQSELNHTRGGIAADLMVAERERDTALERVKELETEVDALMQRIGGML